MEARRQTVPSFFASYGDVDDDTMVRARGRAVAFGVMLLGIGQAWKRGLDRLLTA